MKSTIKKRTWKAIYRLLDRVSPLPYDCGALCNAACCCGGSDGFPFSAETDTEGNPICPAASCDANGDMMADPSLEDDGALGIYLYPGEDKIHDKKDPWLKWTTERAEDYEFPDSWVGNLYFVRCQTPPSCPREKRPLQCRTYPLLPHLTEDGFFFLVRNNDPDLPYRCPLVEDAMELDPRFVRATYTAWKHLLRDPKIFDLVEMDSRAREESGIDLQFEEVTL